MDYEATVSLRRAGILKFAFVSATSVPTQRLVICILRARDDSYKRFVDGFIGQYAAINVIVGFPVREGLGCTAALDACVPCSDGHAQSATVLIGERSAHGHCGVPSRGISSESYIVL